MKWSRNNKTGGLGFQWQSGLKSRSLFGGLISRSGTLAVICWGLLVFWPMSVGIDFRHRNSVKSDSVRLSGAGSLCAQPAQDTDSITEAESELDRLSKCEIKNGRGLLWKIENPILQARGVPPSYLFGTMHVSDADILVLPEPVKKALHSSQSYCMEVLPEMYLSLALGRRMYTIDPEENVQAALIPADYNRLKSALARKGFSEKLVSKLKPWGAGLLLSAPSRSGPVLDHMLYNLAVKDRKSVCALESIQGHLDTFDKLPRKNQIEMLLRNLNVGPRQKELHAYMKDKYLARDPGAILCIMQAGERIDGGSGAIFRKRLLDQRNYIMVDSMRGWVETDGVFAAVGAAHLPGEFGMVNLLHNSGYKVSLVY